MGCAWQGVDSSKVVGKRGRGVHESQLSDSVHGKQLINECRYHAGARTDTVYMRVLVRCDSVGCVALTSRPDVGWRYSVYSREIWRRR